MDKKCSTCGYEIKDRQLDRCPRCHTIIEKYNKCSNCAGCGVSRCDTPR